MSEWLRFASAASGWSWTSSPKGPETLRSVLGVVGSDQEPPHVRAALLDALAQTASSLVVEARETAVSVYSAVAELTAQRWSEPPASSALAEVVCAAFVAQTTMAVLLEVPAHEQRALAARLCGVARGRKWQSTVRVTATRCLEELVGSFGMEVARETQQTADSMLAEIQTSSGVLVGAQASLVAAQLCVTCGSGQGSVVGAAAGDESGARTLKVAGSLLNAMADLGDWDVLRLVEVLTPLAQGGYLPPAALAPHCSRLAHAENPLKAFAAAELGRRFLAVWTPLSPDITSSLCSVVENPCREPFWRILAVAWISALSGRLSQESLRPMWSHLAPTAFDSTEVLESRLLACSWCVLPEAAPRLLDLLVCFDSYSSYRPGERFPRVVASVLARWLCSFPTELTPGIFKILCALMLSRPEHLRNVLQMIDALPSVLASSLLEHFGSALCALRPEELPIFLSLAGRIARDPSLSPRPVLQVLTSLVDETDLCETGAWHIGSQVLDVCRRLVLTHSVSQLFFPLCSLLRDLCVRFRDPDIKDRAKFLLALLSHVPSGRLRQVLEPRRALTAPVAMASPSSDADATPRQRARASLERTVVSPPVRLARVENSKRPMTEVVPVEAAPATLQEHLESLKLRPVTVPLPIELLFAQQQQRQGDDALFAVVLSFQPQSAMCGPVPPLRVPCLHRRSPHPPVSLMLSPVTPLPFVISASLEYTNDEGKPCFCQLEPLCVGFEDLMLPLPGAATLFEDLWARLSSLADSTECDSSGYPCAIEFVKHIRLSPDDTRVALSKRLSPFTLPDDPSSFWRAAVLLPPRHHLLLRLSHIGESRRDSLLRVVTDYWRCSIFLDSLFDTLLSS